ncbi:bifunctional uroporphyrinogen-III C-methyltransferase/uroporphyrinogen-III synthase [Corynebacterium sp. 13CS0277]|uniref:uroporphyrinogen-III synthase n=1 Tax=Corynebacterium sp. 13CS0277 TaxID=2071994 RepID=UPI000D0473E6|nr:uroporphyrinogen-III synthase [Corynebacterium sp. 13CS0277]PRQ10677.1 bifunctional uroporphyrinogen-III C-methyltransferase/uroporphyrinogen-III synthase [Corynebacterium sp. 13CS0277]
MTHPAPGTVIFVGAGPGNPDLLTVRARDVMARTRRALVDPRVHAGVREKIAGDVHVTAEQLAQWEADYAALCEEHKAAGVRRRPPKPPAPSAALIEITDAPAADVVARLVELAAGGDDVIRLVPGNPLTSDAVLKEIDLLTQAGHHFQVVPGMSVPSTVPAFAGIGLGSTYTETDVRGDVDWEALAAAPQPLVLLADSEHLAGIATGLTDAGLAAATPVSVTVHGTTRLQRTHDLTIGTLAKLDADLPGELVVTVGREVGERTKYSWWENRALYGWRVLVPRAKEQAAPMSTRLATHGAIPMEVPTISVEPPRNPAPMERAVKGIVEGRYQWIALTSVNAVNALWQKMTEFGLDARSFAGVHIAAVGTKTAEAIRGLGLTPELLPARTQQNAAGLVEVFPDFDEDLDPVGRVLLPRADIATDVLVQGLQGLGWEVDDIVAYRTVRAAPPAPEIRDMIKTGGFDAVCFTSASTVKNLVGIAGKPHARTIIAAIGPMTAAAARDAGLRVDVQPEEATVPALVDALAAHVAALRAADQLPPPKKKRRRDTRST